MGAGALSMRYEPDTSHLYIVKSELKLYCDRLNYNFKELESDLSKSGRLVDRRKRYAMSKGWNKGVSNQRSWTLQLKYEEKDFEDGSE